MEESLIYRAQKGDQWAFQQLVEIYHDIAWRTTHVLLSDRTAAEDALQDAWIDVQNNPKELHLRLIIPYSRAGKSSLQRGRDLTFNITIPFHPGHVTNLHQSITVNGRTVILERVLVAPSSVRVYINGFSGPSTLEHPHIDFSLFVGTQKYHFEKGSSELSTWFMDFPKPSTFDAHTRWTLVAQQTEEYDVKKTAGGYIAKSRPLKGATWTFHFVVS